MIGKVLISVGSLILAYSAYCHRDCKLYFICLGPIMRPLMMLDLILIFLLLLNLDVRYKIRIDANAHSDALLTYEVCLLYEQLEMK